VSCLIRSFYATDAGRQHFADQLTSIRYCVQEVCSKPAIAKINAKLVGHTRSHCSVLSQTCNFDTLFAYLTCGNYDFIYDKSKNLRSKRNIKSAMNNEVMLYGIAQKEQLGFDKAVEECKYRAFCCRIQPKRTTQTSNVFLFLTTHFIVPGMSRYGVTPNMMVLPPQMLLYMALAPEQSAPLHLHPLPHPKPLSTTCVLTRFPLLVNRTHV